MHNSLGIMTTMFMHTNQITFLLPTIHMKQKQLSDMHFILNINDKAVDSIGKYLHGNFNILF